MGSFRMPMSLLQLSVIWWLPLAWGQKKRRNAKWFTGPFLAKHIWFSIDYRFEQGRFWVSMSCLTISNLDSLYIKETGTNPRIIIWKEHLSEWARCQKVIDGIYFTRKWRAKTITTWFRYWHFQTPALKRYLQMHLLTERFFFGGDDQSFLKGWVKTYLMAPMSLFNPAVFSAFTSKV
jgi:hypothetical protein